MLAGRVKLKRFLLYAGAVGFIGCAGLVYTCVLPDGDHHDQGNIHTPTPPAPPAPEPPARIEQAGEEHLAAVLAWRGEDLGGPKIKDASSGSTFKINLYQDEGHGQVNRAKVDLDRDERWDEQWTFEAGGVTRQVAPEDDESYTVTLLLAGDEWLAEGVEPQQANDEPASATQAAMAQQPWIAVVLSYQGRDLGSAKLKDVSEGQRFKVNVYQDEGNSTANRAKVDVDRDDKWDQKWTFDGATVSVKIAPADDEDYSQQGHWSDQGLVLE